MNESDAAWPAWMVLGEKVLVIASLPTASVALAAAPAVATSVAVTVLVVLT